MIKINAKVVEFERYPNGETKINTDIEYGASSEVVLYFESNEDLLHLMFLQNLYQFETLVIRYMPYSRQDRAVGGGAFTLKWVSQFINSLGFETIYIDDPHSDVTMALIDNSMQGESSLDLLNEVIEQTNFSIENDYLFFPDAGAQKKYISEVSFKSLVGFKQRDNSTGKITHLEILGKRETGDKIIIVDDICSYGGTFILAAKALRQMFDKVYLCVYHLELSVYKGELLTSGLIDGIWCSDSMMRESNHELIHIIGD